ncbi:MAG: glycine-rich domain-containing protein-like [Bdellovibrionota bacterium]
MRYSNSVIKKIDLKRIVSKISSNDIQITHSEKRWSRKKANEAVKQYKRYLWLIKKYQKKHKFIPPSYEIDYIWHAHILDTKAYARDCKKAFGKILHHDPYFGVNGKSDRKNLFNSFQLTQDLYKAEFGEYIYSLDDE